MTSALHENFINDFPEFKGNSLIEKAFKIMISAHDGQLRKSGEPYAIHPYNVARILAEMNFDEVTICSGLLHDVIEDTAVSDEDIIKEFGSEVANIVDGVTKLNRIDFKSKEDAQAESFRKMFLAMATDIRVIIVKMADRLHNMRTIEFHKPEKQREKAKETLDIYAPLARRLGIYVFEGEFEELSLQVLEPEAYSDIKNKLEKICVERQEFIDNIVDQVNDKILGLSLNNVEVKGRFKKIYSIYKKMHDKNVSLEELYDLFAVRVIVDSVKDCYAVLGTLHAEWRPLPMRFKDYIAVPKENMYQSLHTTLLGERGIPFEVQIRTHEMHAVAEYGIAAHWMYKENGSIAPVENKLSWINELLDWQKEMKDSKEFMETVKFNFFSDNVFVFTPKGDVKDFVKGATPLDFAYGIHSAIGHKCVGAKVNGRLVPLNYELKTGDIVEIVTSPTHKGPSRDWLNMVKTASARSKIRAWFRKELKEDNIRKGKDMLEKEAKRLGYELNDLMRTEWIKPIFKKFSLNSFDDLFATVGYGGMTTGQVLTRLIHQHKNLYKIQEKEKLKLSKANFRTASETVTVKGYNDIVVRFAHCCNPIPGDSIIGFITRGRGVTVHRTDCTNVRSGNLDETRKIDVKWNRQEDQQNARFLAEIRIDCNEDRPGIMVELTQIIFNNGFTMCSINARNNKNNCPCINIGLEINAVKELESLMDQLRKIQSVSKVYRVNS